MTAPNIINVTSITGKTVAVGATTNLTTLLDNPPNSNKLLKINTLYAANVNGSASADISVGILTDTTNPLLVYRYLAKTVTITADTTGLILGRDGPIYLEEGARLVVQASIVNYIDVICSYEEIT